MPSAYALSSGALLKSKRYQIAPDSMSIARSMSVRDGRSPLCVACKSTRRVNTRPRATNSSRKIGARPGFNCASTIMPMTAAPALVVRNRRRSPRSTWRRSASMEPEGDMPSSLPVASCSNTCIRSAIFVGHHRYSVVLATFAREATFSIVNVPAPPLDVSKSDAALSTTSCVRSGGPISRSAGAPLSVAPLGSGEVGFTLDIPLIVQRLGLILRWRSKRSVPGRRDKHSREIKSRQYEKIDASKSNCGT